MYLSVGRQIYMVKNVKLDSLIIILWLRTEEAGMEAVACARIFHLFIYYLIVHNVQHKVKRKVKHVYM